MIDKSQLKLPSISEAGRQALELLNDDLIDMAYLADYLGKDPTISATLLKYANSPTYKRKVEVKSVRNAVSLLGKKTCKMIVGLTILKTYRSSHNHITEQIWSHCTNVATVARVLAGQLFPDIADDIETTALMHDIGMLVLVSSFPDAYAAMLDAALADNVFIEVAEQKTFGCTHSEVIKFLVPILQLPSVTVETIQRFHGDEILIDVVSESDRHLVICQLAHHIVQGYEGYVSGKQMTEHLSHDLDVLAFLLKLNDNQLKDLIEDSEMMLDVL